MDLCYAEQYDDLNSEANRSPAQPCGAPALTRHIAFWPTPDRGIFKSASDAKKKFDERRWIWFQEIDTYIAGVLAKIQDADFLGPLKREETRFISRSPAASDAFDLDRNAVYFNFKWLGHLVKIQILPHNEYVTISTVIDLSKGPADYDKNDPVSKAFIGLRSALDNPSASAALTERIADYLYAGIWDEFDRTFTGMGGDPSTGGKGIGSEIFADFRGVVLYSNQEDNIHSVQPSTGEPRTGFGKVVEFDDTTEARCLERIWPLIEAASGGPGTVRQMEFTACSMLDRRAIYISSLGSKTSQLPPATDKTAPRIVVRYTLAVNGFEGNFDRWQLGRLIHRINMLGTLRLIALRDFRLLRKTNLSVMVLGRRLDDTYRGLGKTPLDREALNKELNDFFFHLSNVGDAIPYGITYRINRSRYFAKTFKSILRDLRIKRIPGWQPYDEFVRRRLFSVYESIDMLGHRLEAIRQRANTLLDVLNTSQLVEYQKIADLIIVPAFTYYVGNMAYKFIHLPIAYMSTYHGGTATQELIKTQSGTAQDGPVAGKSVDNGQSRIKAQEGTEVRPGAPMANDKGSHDFGSDVLQLFCYVLALAAVLFLRRR